MVGVLLSVARPLEFGWLVTPGKYLSKGAFDSSGVFSLSFDLSFDDDLSFEALRFCCTFWNADMAEDATDVLEMSDPTLEMSDPEPNSLSSLFRVNFLSFPIRPAFFFFP